MRRARSRGVCWPWTACLKPVAAGPFLTTTRSSEPSAMCMPSGHTRAIIPKRLRPSLAAPSSASPLWTCGFRLAGKEALPKQKHTGGRRPPSNLAELRRAADCLQPSLRCGVRQPLTPSVGRRWLSRILAAKLEINYEGVRRWGNAPHKAILLPVPLLCRVFTPRRENAMQSHTSRTETLLSAVFAGVFRWWLAVLLTLSAALAQAEPFAYITNLVSANVSVIDTASNTVVATVPVGANPQGVAVTPDGAFV